MSREYADAASFRQALEARLERTSAERGVPRNTLRQKVVMERFLARLFTAPTAPWRLKGGCAMEMRLAGRARTTRDIDLAAAPMGSTPVEAHDQLLRRLRDVALLELGDFLDFAVAGPGKRLATDQMGGFRFSVTASLGGRRYAGFHVDVGLDATPDERPESATCDDHLDFAGIAPANVLLIPRERHFAEKLHAYTRPWGDRANTRTKDLVDLLLLLEIGPLDRRVLARALSAVFGHAKSHPLPPAPPAPPHEWASDYTTLAGAVALAEDSLPAAFERLTVAWKRLGLGGPTAPG